MRFDGRKTNFELCFSCAQNILTLKVMHAKYSRRSTNWRRRFAIPPPRAPSMKHKKLNERRHFILYVFDSRDWASLGLGVLMNDWHSNDFAYRRLPQRRPHRSFHGVYGLWMRASCAFRQSSLQQKNSFLDLAVANFVRSLFFLWCHSHSSKFWRKTLAIRGISKRFVKVKGRKSTNAEICWRIRWLT